MKALPGMPSVGPHRPLVAALGVDALGTGLFLPFALLYFTATTDLPLPRIGFALSLAAFVRLPATAASGVLLDRIGPAHAVVLLLTGTGPRLTVILLVMAALLITLTELIQGPTVSAIVNEAASDHDRGRYVAIHQLTYSVVGIVAPAVLTWSLSRGPVVTWVPLILIALLNAAALALLPPICPPCGGAWGRETRRDVRCLTEEPVDDA